MPNGNNNNDRRKKTPIEEAAEVVDIIEREKLARPVATGLDVIAKPDPTDFDIVPTQL